MPLFGALSDVRVAFRLGSTVAQRCGRPFLAFCAVVGDFSSFAAANDPNARAHIAYVESVLARAIAAV